jgi:hypothetical protein
MSYTTHVVQVVDTDGVASAGELKLRGESPDDEELVQLQLTIPSLDVVAVAANYFEALKRLRLHLEERYLFIRCYGASRDVYPSPMMLNMGEGRLAYRLIMGKQAVMKDAVDIFDNGSDVIPCTVQEQEEFYQAWLSSLT